MYTEKELNTQIKRFLSTAETCHEKGARHWAYAKNGQCGYHYDTAKKAYAQEAVCKEKAAMYQQMLASGDYIGLEKAAMVQKSFVGNSEMQKSVSAACQSAVHGAVAAAALAVISGVVDGDSEATIAESAASSAAVGGAVGLVSNAAATGMSSAIGTAMQDSALASTLAGKVVSAAVPTAVAIAVGQLALVAAKPFVEETVDGILHGDPVAGMELGYVEASIAVDDFVEATTGPVRDGFCDILEGLGNALDSFSDFLDWI